MSIAENLKLIEDGILKACATAKRNRDEVKLVPVSKTKPLELIEEAMAAGQRIFGENKVQEVVEKGPRFPEAEIHFIGHLQKNKVRKVVQNCEVIHSVDSLALAQRVDSIVGQEERETRIFIQVNVANDDAKFGMTYEEALNGFDQFLRLQNVSVVGLMTIPNFDPDPEATRPAFARLKSLRDEIVARYGCDLQHLSMGMSHDYYVAIEEGATYVRVGSSIFGARG